VRLKKKLPYELDGGARNEREWRDTHFRVRGPTVGLGLV
jgi:hypothetical protein